MKKLGIILHKSKSGYLVVRLVNVPPIGIKVYDNKLRFIGIIKDVIGPVREPYALVKVMAPRVDEQSLINTLLYFREPKKPMKGARRKGKPPKRAKKSRKRR